MTLEEYITGLIGPLFAGELYWDTTPEGYARPVPFVIVQQVGGKESWYIDKEEDQSHRHARLMFTCRNKRKVASETMRKAIADALRECPFASEPYGAGVSGFDDALNLYSVQQQFGIWFPYNYVP